MEYSSDVVNNDVIERWGGGRPDDRILDRIKKHALETREVAGLLIESGKKGAQPPLPSLSILLII